MAAVWCALSVGVGLGLLALPRLRLQAAHLWAALGGLLGGLGGWILTGWPIAALAGGVGGVLLPASIRAHRANRQATEQTEALAEAAAGLRDAVRAGHALQEAFAAMARYGPLPLRAEFERLTTDARLHGTAEALGAFAARLGDPLADLLVAILQLNTRLGGRQLTASLDALAHAVRAEALTLRELHARQAEQRLSARVVAATPIVCLLALRLTNPALLAPYDTLLGQLVLTAAAGLIAAGYLLALRLGRPPPAIRLAGATRSRP